MKIAIISDIHGNMQALNSVLSDIESQGCEKIFCLGDLAMAGPQPVEAIIAIKMLVEHSGLELIQGNTDEMIANYDKFAELAKSKFPVMGSALENDSKLIGQDLKDFLNGLNPQKDISIEGVKILLVHGSPRKNDENIFPDLPIAKIEEMLEGVDSDVIFCGHTHIPCGYQTNNNQTVINVGSVGRPFTPEPKACYAIADFLNSAFVVEHRFVDYDKIKASKILAKRSFEGASKLAEILIKPDVRHM